VSAGLRLSSLLGNQVTYVSVSQPLILEMGRLWTAGRVPGDFREPTFLTDGTAATVAIPMG